jgi:glycosyltransferase involved in cell wall biosynthesis
LTAFLRRLRAVAPRARTECTGFVPYENIAPRLRTAHVGIIPYEESAGVHCAFVAKAVEYLAVGLPTVSTRLESISRYFRGEPLIRFVEFDGAAFGQAILAWLAERPARIRELGVGVQQRVQTELDWRTIARRALDFVEARVGGRP